MANQKKLKVKFAGQFRDYLQCRKTKVRITTQPRQVENQIKYYQDSIRDLENILEVLREVEVKNERPCVGELLAGSRPSGSTREHRYVLGWLSGWDSMNEARQEIFQQWGEQFINALQDELYLTKELNREHAASYSDFKNSTVQAVREILERR